MHVRARVNKEIRDGYTFFLTESVTYREEERNGFRTGEEGLRR